MEPSSCVTSVVSLGIDLTSSSKDSRTNGSHSVLTCALMMLSTVVKLATCYGWLCLTSNTQRLGFPRTLPFAAIANVVSAVFIVWSTHILDSKFHISAFSRSL